MFSVRLYIFVCSSLLTEVAAKIAPINVWPSEISYKLGKDEHRFVANWMSCDSFLAQSNPMLLSRYQK